MSINIWPWTTEFAILISSFAKSTTGTTNDNEFNQPDSEKSTIHIEMEEREREEVNRERGQRNKSTKSKEKKSDDESGFVMW